MPQGGVLMTDQLQTKPRIIKPMPSSSLVSLIGLLKAIQHISEGKFTLAEIFDALVCVYKPETYLLYEMNPAGLSQPIDGNPHIDNSGFNNRADLISELFNAHLWRFVGDDEEDNPHALDNKDVMGIPVLNIMISKHDLTNLSRAIWHYLDPDMHEGQNLAPQLLKEARKTAKPKVAAYLDPAHPRFSAKLAAAVRAWEAVSESNGKSIKAELESWLLQHASELGLVKSSGEINQLGIEEVAKVANWQVTGGAPKTPGGNHTHD